MKRSAAGDALSALVVSVFRLHGALIDVGDARLAGPAGQSSARWQVLAAIDESPRAVAEIARMLGLARQSVQRVADDVVEAGLATYEPNPLHRRAKLLMLTTTGRATLETIQAAQRAWANELGAKIGEDALLQANDVIADLLEQLRA
ncbi:MarR family winged helix-turn-helix transcriptional regulator [Nannocystaceae bacterium ST9]